MPGRDRGHPPAAGSPPGVSRRRGEIVDGILMARWLPWSRWTPLGVSALLPAGVDRTDPCPTLPAVGGERTPAPWIWNFGSPPEERVRSRPYESAWRTPKGAVVSKEGGALNAEAGPGKVTRLVLGPLLANHLMILLGAYFLVAGTSGGRPGWISLGASLVGTGIGIELAVLWWSASLVHRSARVERSQPEIAGASAPSADRSLCPYCGWSGRTRAFAACARCNRPTIRMP